jgi:hypothetical protein
MPKDFVGPSEADDLFTIYEKLSRADYSYGYLFAAASAAAESGLMATHLSSDERHFRLQCADEAWQDAQAVFLDKHGAKGWSEAKLEAIPDRVEMNRIYMPMYHDLVDGNMREVTISKTHERLVKLGLKNLRLHDGAEEVNDPSGFVIRRGLGYELCTLMTVTRLKCPSFFAIPATARADHGTYHGEETHDVRLIRQSWGKIEQCVPYEVKPSDGTTRDRYKSAFVRGRVELMMPSATHPMELATYMGQELRGDISLEHFAELNEITSRVLRQAVDYTNQLPLAGRALRAVAS